MKETGAADKERLELEGEGMKGRQIARSLAAVLLLSSFRPPSASAQLVISAGAKGGVNIANVDLELTGVTVSATSRAGLVIGGFVAADKEKAGLVVEGLFSQHGTTLLFTQGADTDKQEIRLNYILIPV